MRYGPRFRRIERLYPPPAVLDLGEGRSVDLSAKDREDAFFACLSGEDHPIVEAIRSAEDTGRTGDAFAILIRALEGDMSLRSEGAQEISDEPEKPRPDSGLPLYERNEIWRNASKEERAAISREKSAERWRKWRAEHGM